MRLYSASCPVCGHRNRKLYLEDSEGWMECEACGSLSLILKNFDRNTGKASLSVENPVLKSHLMQRA